MESANKEVSLFRSGSVLPFVLITSLFFVWGLANNMTDTLLAAFKRIMSMSDFQTSWIQIAFYGAYFCLALPAAILIKRYTYKTGILVGLGLFILGSLLFYPASLTMSYGFFLLALYILAGGLSILETAANPYIIALGPEESGTRRLNLAQSFNPIGSISGVLLSKVFILSQLKQLSAEERATMDPDKLAAVQLDELEAVMAPYVGVALCMVVLWILVKVTKMPKASDTDSRLDLLPTFRRLAKRPHYVWAVVAQFFYVGAQIGVWSFSIRYVMQELKLNEEAASNYYIYSLVLFMVCRFVFTALMKYILPRTLLLVTAAAAITLTLVVIYGSGLVGVYALIGISGCMSLMFPTIYGMGLESLGDDTKIGGAGLIMAILGGAVLTSVQGYFSDLTQEISVAFYVPLACFMVVALYALGAGRFESARQRAKDDDTTKTPVYSILQNS
ncbi:L-fucose:H+ symporter permease [Rufibacter tibetensis]|uniref:Fucose permease n=1 Tax=Rufibacter tibetensis TaxID=512763 RepID=A0A0P0CD77_9BACT|nr:L-fucose:H+ symporter permease [Rufibacter tibetensis]ALJ01652.1 fucose permease [Rufibacter tibetensis]